MRRELGRRRRGGGEEGRGGGEEGRGGGGEGRRGGEGGRRVGKEMNSYAYTAEVPVYSIHVHCNKSYNRIYLIVWALNCKYSHV